MIKLTAREIIGTSREDIWKLVEGEYEVTYDDGHVSLGHKQSIIFNRYCWELIKLYPKTPINANCDVVTFLGDTYFNISTPVKLLEQIFNHICEFNRIYCYKDKDPLLKSVYQVANLIFNEVVHRVSDSVTTLDATDFIDVIEDPDIKDLHERLIPYPESVELTYRGIRAFMNSPEKQGRFVDAYRAKAINENQANQCIGPRGFVTNLDRTVYKKPIMNGFIRGMGDLYEVMAESRTAAKSLNATEDSIRSSEYASRRVQLLTMAIDSVTNEDCRSTEYLDIVLTRKYLSNMKGIWYVENEGDKLKYLKGDEEHLIDKVIKIRSVFGCKTPNPHQICTKCVGRISENFLENSNLGYTSSASLMEMLTQSILSTKHLTHSVKKSAIILDGAVLKYMYSTDENEIFLREDVDFDNLAIVLPSNRLNKLTDVLSLDHTNVALNKLGELETIVIRNLDRGTNETINVAYRDRLSTISRPLLKYIRNVNFDITARGDYIIPLKDFDKKQPLFENSIKETDVLNFVRVVAGLIEVTTTGAVRRSLKEHFFKIVDTIYDQLSVNLSIIQVMVYATTAYNIDDGNFRLGRNSPNMKQAGRAFLFRNRSISQLLVFEKQKNELLNHAPRIFSNEYRSDHPLDVLFRPQDVIDK